MNKKLFFTLVGIFVIVYTLAYTTYYYEIKPEQIVNVDEPIEDIIYREIDDYEDIIATFQCQGYSTDEINKILGYLSDDNIKKLAELPYYDLTNYLDIRNFNVNNIDRYNTFKEANNDLTYNAIVTRVNLNLDKEFYSESKTIKKPNKINVLVNKFNKLDKNYEPEDLTYLNYSKAFKMRKEAAKAFDKLQASALVNNISIYPYSAYRSYKKQKEVYNDYKKKMKNNVDTYSARPGYSEHQTGLAVDIKSTGYDNVIDKHYKWLKDNAYKYGFIIRYPKNKEDITGYQEEPWHLRYIGINDATKMYELNISYDEYYDLYIREY